MSNTNDTKADRALSELELDSVTGGALKPPNNSTILINKPKFPDSTKLV